MTASKEQLPTEAMVIAGFEAVSMFQETDAYKELSGCQGAAESARVCWAAMVAELPEDMAPRQDVMPTDAQILGARYEAGWAHYGDELDILCGRILLARYGHAAPQWLPIDSAPRTGRSLILLLTPSWFPQVAWSNTWWTAGFSVENKPSHWMPIPNYGHLEGEAK